MKSLTIFCLIGFLLVARSCGEAWHKCPRGTGCVPDKICQQVADNPTNREQVCGNDGKSYAHSCIACRQQCRNLDKFRWKSRPCPPKSG